MLNVSLQTEKCILSEVMAKTCHNSSAMSNSGENCAFSGTPNGVSFFAFIRFFGYYLYYCFYGLSDKCSTADFKCKNQLITKCAA